ncbi:MAG TPA: hemerythrin domain-containing protein [Casimicrobiaceae bacterium]|nr:hemerythrin domain-containing protein [Casimicrobiaceae bacterium]
MPTRSPRSTRTNGHATGGATQAARKRRGGSGGRAAPQRTEVPRAPASRPVSPRAAVDNVLAVLRADHDRVLELFARFDKLKSNGPQKAQLVERICDELELHTRVEDELFYPSVRPAIGDDDLMDEAAVEHESSKTLIEQLRGMKPGDNRYDAIVTVLGEYVKHHVVEEQDVMFPKVKATDLDLVALGRAVKTRKRQLKGDAGVQGLLGLAAFPGMMIP